MERYDLVVIGGGAGGMSAVDAGVRRGARTLLVQDGPLGGDCTWTGCVPSKALIAAAARGADPAGALAAARTAIDDVAATETADVSRARGIEVRAGRARFLTRQRIEIDGDVVDAGRVVVATGATPSVPPIPGLRDATPLTSDTLWSLDALPASLAVLGGGPIGIELAQALARLGVRVTVLEAMDRILGREEPETVALVADRLRADGATVRTGARVAEVARRPDGSVAVTVEGDDDVVEADDVLVAIGRRPVTDGLDVAAAGIRLDERGHVVTDDAMATTAPGVFAVGDVTGRFPFTHGAYAQGLVAVGNALGPVPFRRFRSEVTPFVTFTDPEIGRVGLTEAEAFARHGEDATVVVLPMAAVDRAIVERRTEGFVKLVVVPVRALGMRTGGRLVGATVVAPHAGEFLHELALAVRLRIPPAALALATHAYPTWSMAVQQAASGLFLDLERGERRPARAG